MRIVVTGTRGVPRIQGGIETHCEQLFPRLADLGFEIILIRRSCYIEHDNRLTEFKGIKLHDIYAPHQKSLEAIIHTFLSIIWAKVHKADIVHIHAIGPGLMIPLARLMGLKVVFTHHGPDYDRMKWGRLAKLILRKGEKLAIKYASEVIVISSVINDLVIKKHGREDNHLIFNGVSSPTISIKTDYIESLGLKPRKYVFALGRFVGEKGFDLLINTFKRLDSRDLNLVIAGDSDHETTYSRKLKELARGNGVILTGFIKGEKLHQLFSQARLFILPSYHEGLPISLLEAMSYKLPVLVSDIPANKQVGLEEHCYFETGNENSLLERLSYSLRSDFNPVLYDMSPYNWDRIALQTKGVYQKLFDGC